MANNTMRMVVCCIMFYFIASAASQVDIERRFEVCTLQYCEEMSEEFLLGASEMLRYVVATIYVL